MEDNFVISDVLYVFRWLMEDNFTDFVSHYLIWLTNIVYMC